jgi:hypothetical protein
MAYGTIRSEFKPERRMKARRAKEAGKKDKERRRLLPVAKRNKGARSNTQQYEPA